MAIGAADLSVTPWQRSPSRVAGRMLPLGSAPALGALLLSSGPAGKLSSAIAQLRASCRLASLLRGESQGSTAWSDHDAQLSSR